MSQLPPAQSSAQTKNLAKETGRVDPANAQSLPRNLSKNAEKPTETGIEFASVMNIVSSTETSSAQTTFALPSSLPTQFQGEIEPQLDTEEPEPDGGTFAIPLPTFPNEEGPAHPHFDSNSPSSKLMNAVSETFNSGTDGEGETISTMPNDASISDTKPEIFSNSTVNEVAGDTSDFQTSKTLKTVAVQKAVTTAVVDTLVQQVETADNGVAKKIVLQLHPAELGQVTLQVDWENDSLRARILTNEIVASEILNQNKQELVAALSENGLNFDSLDVAYQQAEDSSQGKQDNNHPAPATELEQETTHSLLTKSNNAIVDIVI